MLLHCLPVCASVRRKVLLGSLLWSLLILLAPLGAAVSAPHDNRKHAEHEIEPEHKFGFTEGRENGGKGETEIGAQSTRPFGRLGGSYNQGATALEAKYSLSDWFRLSGVATVAYYDITGVSGIDDRHQVA